MKEIIEMAKPKATLVDVEALASKLEPKIAKAILDAFLQQQDRVSIDDVVAALKAGDVGKVMDLLDVFHFDAASGVAQSSLQNAVFVAGTEMAGKIAMISGVTFRFNQLNPRLITWLQTYSFDLIRQINAKTRDGIREILVSGMKAGSSPIDTAREVKAVIGLTARQAKAIENFRRELETFHLRGETGGGYSLGSKISRRNGRQVFAIDETGSPIDGILERRLRDFRFDRQLAAAAKNSKPLTPEQIDKMVDAYARKYLKYRAETIARTESLRATNMGVQDAWRQAIDAGAAPESYVRRKWIVARDERTCPVCSAVPKMNGKYGVKFAMPFATPNGPVMLPPLHPDCRCTVVIRVIEPSQAATETVVEKNSGAGLRYVPPRLRFKVQ